jgi:hypothetical protein
MLLVDALSIYTLLYHQNELQESPEYIIKSLKKPAGQIQKVE